MNKRLISLLVGVVAAGSVTSSSPAQALTWNLDNVKFLFGSASGTFEYDPTNGYSNVSITTSNPGLYPSTTFNASNIYSSSSNNLFLEVDTGSTGNTRYTGLKLSFTEPLTDAGGIVPLNISNSASFIYTSAASEFTGSNNKLDAISGSVSSVPFDIPGGATIPTVGSLLALGAMRQVKKKMVAKNSVANPVSEPVK